MGWLLIAALALQGKAAVGDKMTVTVDSTLDLIILVEDGNGKTDRELHVGRHEKFTQEVSKVADGAPEAVSITCVASTLEQSGTNLLLETKSTPLAGRSFKAQKTVGVWAARDAEGNAAPSGGQALGAWNDVARLLPKAAPTANASWKVEAADVAPLLLGAGVEEPSGSLECVCDAVNGDQWVVSFKGTVMGKARDRAALVLTVTAGKLAYDGAKSRPVSLSMAGGIESKREITEKYRKPNEKEDLVRKVGQIIATSKKFEVAFSFE
jgi:hypothetical protein